MSIQSTQPADAAQLLHDAQRSGVPISPLTQTYPNLDVAQAYSVQRLNLARYLDDGAALRGHKIGLTCAPMQQLLGVNEPDFGYILDSTVLPNGAAIPVTAFCAPRVEPEVAFLMRAPLQCPREFSVVHEDELAGLDAGVELGQRAGKIPTSRRMKGGVSFLYKVDIGQLS